MDSEELDALRTYVTGEESLNRSSSTVLLRVTHSNLKSQFNEIRFDKHASPMMDE